MRIVSWNCNMALRRKLDLVLELEPDVLVVQECAERDIAEAPARFAHWVGANRHKGLGILGLADLGYALAEPVGDDLPWFLPVHLGVPGVNLVGVWACRRSSAFRYVRVSHAAVDRLGPFLRAAPTIAIGDFNSNAIWDGEHGDFCHSTLIERLRVLGLESAYHRQAREPQGAESQPTLFMYRDRRRPYHIDYALASTSLLSASSLRLGDPGRWLSASDHVPLVLDILPGG